MDGWIDTATDPYELSGIARRTKVEQFFHDYSLWNPEVSDGSELQEMAFKLGITPAEWEANRQSVAVEF